MGICVQKITGDGPMKDENAIYDIEHGFIWVIMRIDPKKKKCKHRDWYIQGIATHESIAVESCQDENYFIGPLPLNTALPHDLIEWIGSYFPLDPERETDIETLKREN